jgi:hypothetical protein
MMMLSKESSSLASTAGRCSDLGAHHPSNTDQGAQQKKQSFRRQQNRIWICEPHEAQKNEDLAQLRVCRWILGDQAVSPLQLA